MHSEFILEAKRQAVHIFVGSLIAVAFVLLRPIFGVLTILPLLLSLIFLYFAPRIYPEHMLVKPLLDHFERDNDKQTFPFKGAFYFNTGIILPLLLLPPRVAVSIVLILAIGDSFSTLIGKFYGKHRIGNKSLEGSIAFFLSTLFVTLSILPLEDGIMLSFAGTLIELFSPYNDNLSLPIGLTLLYLFVF